MTLIAAAGDVVLMKPLRHPTGSLLGVLRDVDVFAANLEVPLTKVVDPQRGGLVLHGDPELVEDLARLGLDVVGLANNHLGDHGWGPLRELAERLEARRMAAIGIGSEAGEAVRPRRVGGVGFIAASAVSPAQFLATDDRPGMAGAAGDEDVERLLGAVAAAREAGPVAVLMHWGVPHVAEVQPDQRELARRLAQAGASAIFGAHSHGLQEVEEIAGVPVFYGLSSLVFQYQGPGADRFGRETAIALVDLDPIGRATSWRLERGRLDENGEPVR
ncbi:MAG TPA: CapA family protein [Candidatus Dormibacteraeota bacterium]